MEFLATFGKADAKIEPSEITSFFYNFCFQFRSAFCCPNHWTIIRHDVGENL